MKYILAILTAILISGCGDETTINIDADGGSAVQVSSSGEVTAEPKEPMTDEEATAVGLVSQEEIEADIAKIKAGYYDN